MTARTPTETVSDAALAAAYRTGDERAAAELVHRHAAALGRFLYSSGASEVDDLVQETFFRAFRAIERWRGEASFRAWLFTIGSNLMRDDFRRRKGQRFVPLDDRDLPDRTDPDADLAAAETAERIRSGLGRLPRLQRAVFLLRSQEGSDYEQIAAALGTTPGAARVHYHHAVRRLKELVR